MTPRAPFFRFAPLVLVLILALSLLPIRPATAVAADDSCVTGRPQATVVSCYFAAINRFDFPTAYSYLGSNERRLQSYDQFVALFDNLAIDDLQITDLRYGRDVAIVFVHLVRANTDGSIVTYDGTYTVGDEGDGLHILAHALTLGDSFPA